MAADKSICKLVLLIDLNIRSTACIIKSLHWKTLCQCQQMLSRGKFEGVYRRGRRKILSDVYIFTKKIRDHPFPRIKIAVSITLSLTNKFTQHGKCVRTQYRNNGGHIKHTPVLLIQEFKED